MRLNRSMLIVPGTEIPEHLEKSQADKIVIDLEDTVPPSAKDTARTNTIGLVSKWEANTPVGVRINSLESEWGVADLKQIVGSNTHPSFLLLPKIQGDDDVHIVENLLGSSEIGVVPLIENPRAVFNVQKIANQSERICGLLFAAIDFQLNMGMQILGTSDVSIPRYMVQMAASSIGVPAYDMPYLEFGDEDGLRSEVMTARSLGYDGKLAINEAQVEIVNELFLPSREEIAEAKRIINIFDSSESGFVDIGGTLVDKPVISQLREVVAFQDVERP